ncbi:MAG: PRC-barrel domain-containing protein [Ktedonobacteraceae bacterium]|nr:PRC-barrel domain-containing protein [Ktedonobacteraceae bacterium]
MKHSSPKVFLGDLLGSKIVTAEGETLGHVLDIQFTKKPTYQVKALMYGRGGLFHRLHVLNPFRKEPLPTPKSDTIPWEAVDSFKRPFVRLKAGFDVQK